MERPDEAGLDGALETPGGFTIALYPNCYVWYVFLASLDIMLTWIILSPPFMGREVNWLANWIIQHGGLHAMIPYKFLLVLIVITICEIVGRANRDRGRRLAEWSVAITSIPVIVAFGQLILDTHSLLFNRPKMIPI